MAELTAKAREELKDSDFAYVDRQGERHLPIHDEAHIRNAMGRWNQTEFETRSGKEEARKKIVAAARKHGIEIDEDDRISKPAD